MRTVEIPEIGVVTVHPTVRVFFYLLRVLALPFKVLGAVGLGVTTVVLLKTPTRGGGERLPEIIAGGVASGLLLGIGATLKAATYKLLGRFFSLGDWYIVMRRALSVNDRYFLRVAADSIIDSALHSTPDLLIASVAHQVLAEQFAIDQHWHKMLATLDEAALQGAHSLHVKADRAYALVNMARLNALEFDKAIAACDELIANGETAYEGYVLKAQAMDVCGRPREALSILAEIDPATSPHPDPEQVREELRRLQEKFTEHAQDLEKTDQEGQSPDSGVT